MLLVFMTRVLEYLYLKVKGYTQKLDLFLFGLLFYASNRKDTRRFEWRH